MMLNRYNRLALGALVAIAVLALAACGSSSDDNSASSSTGASSGSSSGKTYMVATSADFPPMSFRDTSNPDKVIGFEVDMVKTLMNNLGWKYKLVTSDFNGLIPSVQSGRTDMVVSDVYDTADREKIVDFVDYLKNSFAVMVASKDASSVHSYMDICGKTMGVLTGSAPELDTAKGASKKCKDAGKAGITIRSYPSVAQELPQVSNGNLFSILEEWSSLSYTAKKSGGKYTVVFPDPDIINVGIVVKKGSPLKAKLESAIKSYVQSPDYKANAKKWGIQDRSLLGS
jgi:polar amino acid transport system substrate-binding protein